MENEGQMEMQMMNRIVAKETEKDKWLQNNA